MKFPNPERHNQLITKYFIPSMEGYSAVGGELSLILEKLDLNKKLSITDKNFILGRGLFDLWDFVKQLEETGRADFRILSYTVKRQQRQELWRKFDIDCIESSHMKQMINILTCLDEDKRLSEKDVLWLSTNDYFDYPEIKRKFHETEALFYRQCFEKTNDPWQAVNASSHYRKANLSKNAFVILDKIEIESQKNKHLKSALCTTKGGCKRDLHQFNEALQLAEKAHLFDSKSFHPCTLLGAVNYEIGNYSSGDEWFAKAIERGAKINNVDQELRLIFKRADKSKQEELKRHLLSIDSVRYAWVNDKRKTRL